MRPYELAACVLLGAAIVLARRVGRESRVLGSIIIWVAIACTVFQALYEGWRSQMVPAYLIAALLLFSPVTWFVEARKRAPWERDPRIKLWVKGVFGLLLVGAAAGLSMLAPVFEFPIPSGPLKVGTVNYSWADIARSDPWRKDNGPRELMVHVWYPAEPAADATPGPYLDDAELVTAAIIRSQAPKLPSYILGHLRYVRTRSYSGAPVSAVQPAYPVVVFCHGYGGYRSQDTALCEDLASNGYIVVAPEFAYCGAMSVFPDGRQAPFMNPLREGPAGDTGGGPMLKSEDLLAIWVQDIRFIVNQLEQVNTGAIVSPFLGKLDLAHLGVVGHSFGGSTSVNLCRVDPRFKAGFDLDGHLNALNQDKIIQVPCAFFMAETFLMTPEDAVATGISRSDANRIAQRVHAVRNAYETAACDAYLLVLTGSRHETFTDMPLYTPYGAAFGFGAKVGGARAIEIVNVYALAFFETYLKGKRAPLLDGADLRYPEVQFEHKAAPAPAQTASTKAVNAS